MINLKWTYEGVNHSLYGNGGPDCTSYLTAMRRFWESMLICALSLTYTYYGYKKIQPLQYLPKKVESREHVGKKILLGCMCLTFGCELGFKCATKTLIYLLNPCHIVTIVQIFLLIAPPSRWVTIAFRWHMHSLNGAVLAIAFPVVNTRLLPFEMEIYYLQHILMLVIPVYLLKIGGVYTMEKLRDFSWTMLTLGSWLLYHFLPLQILGLVTEVNLNNMLCPAISDPFRGQNYRVWATGHQSALIIVFGKLYYLIGSSVIWLTRSNLVTSYSNGGDGVNGGMNGNTVLLVRDKGQDAICRNGNLEMNGYKNHKKD